MKTKFFNLFSFPRLFFLVIFLSLLISGYSPIYVFTPSNNPDNPLSPTGPGLTLTGGEVYLPLIVYNETPTTDITLIYPPNGSTLNTIAPVFEWEVSTSLDADHVELYLSSDPTFNDNLNILNTFLQSGSFHFSVNLEPNTTYYWKMHSVKNNVEGAFTTTWTFKTGSGGTILPAPALISPANGSTNSTIVTLNWSSVSGADEYIVHWRLAEYETGYTYTWVSGTSLTLFCDPGINIEWWVTARNDYAIGTDSAIWTFTTSGSAVTSVNPFDEYQVNGDVTTTNLR